MTGTTRSLPARPATTPARRGVAGLTALLTVGLTVGLMAGLTGCGGSDAGSSATATSTAPTGGSAETTSPSATSTATPSVAPTPPASPTTVAPATGPAVALNSVSLHVPDGWKLLYKTKVSVTGSDPSDTDGIGTVIVNDMSSFGAETLDSEANYALKSARRDGVEATRGPDLTVDGVEGYVVSGSSKTYGVYYVFGTVTNGHDVTLLFQYADQTADSQATTDSVLPSISWT